MSFILENIVHLANILYLLSYLVRDILWLRIFTIVAGSSLLPYYYFQPTPLWEAIGWNLIFITINVVQSVLLFIERRPMHLKGEELALYQMVFDRLSPRNFKKLLQQGDWCELDADKTLVSDSEAISKVIIIFDGEVVVRKKGNDVAKLTPGHFVGEMSFLTGKKASADVVALTKTRYVCWSFKVLEQYLPKHPELRATFQNIIGTDLVRKLNVN